MIRLPITNDSQDEPEETLTVSLANPTGGLALGPNSVMTVTIVDDDEPATGDGNSGGGGFAWLELLTLAVLGCLGRLVSRVDLAFRFGASSHE
jgi:hypothetical protein